jgi:hypothetical protein
MKKARGATTTEFERRRNDLDPQVATMLSGGTNRDFRAEVERDGRDGGEVGAFLVWIVEMWLMSESRRRRTGHSSEHGKHGCIERGSAW